MGTMTVAAPGQVNGAGDRTALFLKKYAGEVLTAFSERNVMASRSMVRTIENSKSSTFPASWKAVASYHTPGAEITGQAMNSNERVIVIDDLLISPVFIASIDEAMSHYEFRSEYTKQAGAALAREYDKHLLQVALLAARATTTVTGGSGGTALTAATALTSADVLIAAAFDAAQALDEKDVPESDRYLFVKPDQYYQLVNTSTKLIDRDFASGNGDMGTGRVYRVAGFEIVKTNNLPQANIATGPAAYQGNFSTVAALAMHKSAVGTVKLLDLSVESAYLVQNQGTLIVARMAVGHGILRPESAVEIKTA